MAVFYRAAVAAVAFAATIGASSLEASQVISPAGGTLPRGLPVLVQWTQPASWMVPTVDIVLERTPTLPQSILLAANVSNNGQVYVNLPYSLPCNATHVYRIIVRAVAPGNPWGKYSPDFKLSCEGGSIKVVKTVINDSGGPIANGTFEVDVNCGPNGPNTTLALSNANNFQDSVMYIPLGRQCTITEQAPKAPPRCRWTTTYPQGKSVVINNADKQRDGNPFYQREIHNRLTCLGVGGPTGPVEVDVVGPLTAILAESTTTACCTPNWNSVPSSSYNNPQILAACSAPTQALCTSNAMINCLWNTQDPSCSGAGVSTGTLTILKKVVNGSTTIPPPNTPFQVQVTCSPGGPNVPVTLTSANGFTQVLGNIPANRSCTLVEQAPAISGDLAKRGCRWETSYPDGQIAAMPNPAAALSRTVVNRWTCNKGDETGTITVTKKIRNRTSTPTPSTPFQVQLDCSPSGPSQIVPLTSPDSLQQTFSVPLGSICRIAEIAPAAPSSCHWETSYPNDQEGTVGFKFVVENELLCDEEETGTESGAPCCAPDWSSVPPESYNHPAIIAACSGATQALCPSNAAVNCIWNPSCADAGDNPACVKAGASCTSASRCCGKLTCSDGVCQ